MNLFLANGGFNWYGTFIGLGMLICLVLAYFSAKKRGYYNDIIFDIALCCIPLSIVGARLYYVVFDILGNGNSWTFKEILGIGTGGLSGLAVYGGLIFATLGAIIVWAMRKNKKEPCDRVSFMQLLDLGFCFIILGQAVGRWGNFANGEAYGYKVSWNFFPLTVFIENGINGTGHYLATFFYESMWNFAGFALLYYLYNGKKKSFDGFIFDIYCIYYGIGRAWIEGLRTDSLYILPGIRVSQMLSIIMIIFGISHIIFHLYKAREKGLKPFIYVEQGLLSEKYLGYTDTIMHHPTIYTKKAVKQDEDLSNDFYQEADTSFYDEDVDTTGDSGFYDDEVSDKKDS